MDLQTISMVSKNFNVSTRTLRYYEQIGLLQSIKKDGYMYRTYDESSLKRLEQIIILRKLRIQLKQASKDAACSVIIWQQRAVIRTETPRII
jgi:DNA-binding transcriptional MerR regulator